MRFDFLVMSVKSLNRVEIDLAALRHNYQSIVARTGKGVKVMAIVKADAYGHGMVAVAKVLAGAGVSTFGVAEVEEGVLLREEGVEGDIVVLLGAPACSVPDMVRFSLTPVVYDLDLMDTYNKELCEDQSVLDIHLKVDVGMGRLGILPGQVDDFLTRLQEFSQLRLTGVMSHFPLADEPGSELTRKQLSQFGNILQKIDGRYPGQPVTHIANSAALAYDFATHLDMVRPGISLYGCHPDGIDGPGARQAPLDLRPVMSFKSRILQVKEVDAGYGISYGHTFVTSRHARLAVLPVGYEDGYLRVLSNKAQVLINGQRAPVCGRVCMNACMVDITDIDPDRQVKAGDEVVLMGRQGNEEITADEVAEWMKTISYEVLCLFGSRNRRKYVQ
jgi:alanine racemase